VIGNGDVVDLESAVAMFRDTGCDAVMIGRGAVGNPWLFTRINHHLATGETLPPPTLSQVKELYLEHVRGIQKLWGVKHGYKQVRIYSFYYFGRFNIPDIRARLGSTKTCDALLAEIDEIEQESLARGEVLYANASPAIAGEGESSDN
jgi:tRNA-dihydrouridine synthase B